MQYVGHTYTKKNLFLIWNSNLIGSHVFLFAKPVNLK